MDMVDIAKKYDGYQYVQVAIDILSCFAHCQAIKSKKGVNIIKALQVILKGRRNPKPIRTVRGMEFRSREVINIFKNSEHPSLLCPEYGDQSKL